MSDWAVLGQTLDKNAFFLPNKRFFLLHNTCHFCHLAYSTVSGLLPCALLF